MCMVHALAGGYLRLCEKAMWPVLLVLFFLLHAWVLLRMYLTLNVLSAACIDQTGIACAWEAPGSEPQIG